MRAPAILSLVSVVLAGCAHPSPYLVGPPDEAAPRVEAGTWVAVASARSHPFQATDNVFAILEKQGIVALAVSNAGGDVISVAPGEAERARGTLRAALLGGEATKARQEAERRMADDPAEWRFEVLGS